MFDKLREKVQELKLSDVKTSVSVPNADAITQRDVYRNRFNYGVNFGSLFVLEKYIYDSLFSAGGETEQEAIENLVKTSSVDEAAKKLSEHYASYVGPDDWKWLKQVANVTAIRLPVGYWHVGNGKFITKDMQFHGLQDVYQKAKPWDHVRRIVMDAARHNIGVLIDLHALPGGANKDAHSGESNQGTNRSFFDKQSLVKCVADELLPFIVNDLAKDYDNVIGVQVVNEAAFDEKATNEKNFYARAIQNMSKIDPALPIVISDGWWPEQWADWLNDIKHADDVVIDSHVYRCFSDQDKCKTANELTDELDKTVDLPADKADYMVGEFSCVLDGSTWSKTKSSKDECVKHYGNKQAQVFRSKARWGWFFWTYKFEHGDGGEWGFVPMINKGCLPKRANTDPAIDEGKLAKIIKEHTDYWNSKGGDNSEHWRFEDGLRTGAADILAFNGFDHSRIGRVHYFKNSRRAQYIQLKGDSKSMWEWDQGYDRAITEFNW
ncbi:LAMI_0C05600g1_1 [Lachancea mirantina]|uniref:LAMI_0C05600g1_1 n=1 Tax=Lachancea mirantina TaxID=1230905 RepID=A0A1G4J2P1_9SACH|nr:LAMI_0C05600g1_1 [Lachancea mirantina]